MTKKETEVGPRELLVFGDKTFKIKIPTDAKVTFAPWSPPGKHGYGDGNRLRGTLRIYEGKTLQTSIIGVFSGVTGFRDTTLDYIEEVAVEEGARIWKSDEKGYVREEKVSAQRKWIAPELPKVNNEEGEPKF